jgi:branched-subunit amino acid transport protein
MSIILTIVFMALVTYAPRLLGFVLSGRQVSGFWLRFLNFVPIAVFAALIVPALTSTKTELDSRLLAAALTSLVIWRFKNLSLGIAVGMGSFWLLRSLL